MALNFNKSLNSRSNIIGTTDILNSDLGMLDSNSKKIEESLIKGYDITNEESNYEDNLKKALNDLTNINSDKDNSDSDNDNNDNNKKYDSNVTTYLSNDPKYIKRTEEEKKQQHISNVIKGMQKDIKYDEFNIDKEKEEDDKIILIEQIDNLMDVLDSDNVNLSKIPTASLDMSIQKLREIKKILTLKNDRLRLCIAAEELILALVNILELICNGERDLLGIGICPDLTGWPATVRQKLRRMRPETSMMVSDFMRYYKISGTSRILIELIPSMLLYSKSRYNHKNNINTKNQNYAFNNAIQEMDGF